MEIVNIPIDELQPYSKNAKKHDKKQINNVAESIKQFGFVQPIVVDKDNTVVIGHCRLEAAKQLRMKEVPCYRAEDLTAEQVKKLRNLDNKLNESAWDFDLLADDIEGLDFSDFDIDWELPEYSEDEYESRKQEFEERMASGELSEDDEEYQEFIKKFEAKKTTDDCYTPELVYNAVADYVANKYGVEKARFIRPFYPGGDYQNEKYKSTDIVVDNPPFSIISEIIGFYNDNGIKYFLFAPHLTLFSSSSSSSSCIICGVSVTYANGANVNTSFITNLEGCRFRSSPTLYKAIKTANDENLKLSRKSLPKYSYPLDLVTSSMLVGYSRYGIDFEVSKEQSYYVRGLDSQKEAGKAIFGSGYLISEGKKAEREKAEREKAEREKAEREKAEREKAEREKAEREKAEVWELSEREKEIIRGLSE